MKAIVVAHWLRDKSIEAIEYECGYCSRYVSSERGINNEGSTARIRICPNCGRSTYLEYGMQVPGPIYGDELDHIDDPNVHGLYNEARRAFSVNSFTASVLCCRKLLMNIAVAKKTQKGLRFAEYVSYLADNNYIPPDAKEWVDHIRQLGNQATHEIRLMTREDAELLMRFTEHLLRHIFEFPGRMRSLRNAKTPP